jgi:hypothetical protein
VSVELKVTLVGDDPQQQDAFNNPRPVPEVGPSIDSSSQPGVTSTPVTQQPAPPVVITQLEPPQFTDTRDSTAKSTVTPPPFELPDGYVQPPPINGDLVQLRLINTLEELIDAIDRQTSGQGTGGTPASPEQPQERHQQNIFERMAAGVDSKLNEFGMEHSQTGRHIHHLANLVADLGTRVTKFASATFGGTTAAANGATEAATAAGGTAAAATGATESAAVGGVTAAASTLTGPLIAAGLAAGAFVFTLKKLVDSIESAANDLEDLSPGIAIGRAQHEMTMELKRLDRAKRIGEDVATVDHAMHRISESMYELQTKMYEILLKAAPFFESSLNQVSVGVSHLNVMAALGEKMTAWFTKDKDDDKAADKAIVEAVNELTKARAIAAGQDPDAHLLFDEVLLQVLQMSGDGSPPVKPNRGNGH